MITIAKHQIEMAEAVLKHIPDAARGVMTRAVNRSLESARTEASRKVRQTYYITHKDVISTIKVYKASGHGGDVYGMVTSRGNLLSLMKFRVTPKKPQPKRKKPILVRVKRGEGGPIKRAFVARMQSGHTAVFERAGKSRFPINEKFGPSVPQMLGNPDVAEWVEQKAGEMLEKRLDHEIDRVIGGKK